MQAKKPLALLLSLSMGLSMGSPALAAARETKLPDVSQSWASESIHRWLEAGLVEGDDQGLFRPAANLTRGELATIFVRLLGLTGKAPNRYADLKGDVELVGFASTVSIILALILMPVLFALL